MKTVIKTGIIVLVTLFAFLTTTSVNAQNNTNAEKTYIKIEVDGLSCPFCAYGLEKKLKKVAGSENVLIELTEGEATMNVPKDQQPTKEELQKIVKDAGFTPKEIIFSKTPFKTKKDE
jgi:mercuric ion binding protein